MRRQSYVMNINMHTVLLLISYFEIGISQICEHKIVRFKLVNV